MDGRVDRDGRLRAGQASGPGRVLAALSFKLGLQLGLPLPQPVFQRRGAVLDLVQLTLERRLWDLALDPGVGHGLGFRVLDADPFLGGVVAGGVPLARQALDPPAVVNLRLHAGKNTAIAVHWI